MSDLISRRALLKSIGEVSTSPLNEWDTMGVLNIVNKQPTVEAVPVVRCKNCEHWGTGVAGETEHVKCCEYAKYMVGENGYCCYGADMRKKV